MHAPARLIDPVALTRDLIRSPSVTPVDAGAMATLKAALEGLGFTGRDLPFEGTPNLYARRGATDRTSASPATPMSSRPARSPPGRTTPSPPRSGTACFTDAARSI